MVTMLLAAALALGACSDVSRFQLTSAAPPAAEPRPYDFPDFTRSSSPNGLMIADADGTYRPAAHAYRDLIARKSEGTVWLAGGCASWYLDKHGHNTTLWPDFTFRFRRLLGRWDPQAWIVSSSG